MCPRHPGVVSSPVCGEFRCGVCYGERLLVEPLPSFKQPREPIDLSKGLFGRNEHYRPPMEG